MVVATAGGLLGLLHRMTGQLSAHHAATEADATLITAETILIALTTSVSEGEAAVRARVIIPPSLRVLAASLVVGQTADDFLLFGSLNFLMLVFIIGLTGQARRLAIFAFIEPIRITSTATVDEGLTLVLTRLIIPVLVIASARTTVGRQLALRWLRWALSIATGLIDAWVGGCGHQRISTTATLAVHLALSVATEPIGVAFAAREFKLLAFIVVVIVVPLSEVPLARTSNLRPTRKRWDKVSKQRCTFCQQKLTADKCLASCSTAAHSAPATRNDFRCRRSHHSRTLCTHHRVCRSTT